MSITLHWWHFPTAVTVAYLLWAVVPRYRSSMWGGIDALFGHLIGLFAVAVSWAVCGILFK